MSEIFNINLLILSIFIQWDTAVKWIMMWIYRVLIKSINK